LAISSSTRKAGPFLGNGATTVFPFAFKVFASADLRVVRTNALGLESDLVLDTDYTVALNSNQDNDPGGTVTRATALPTGERLTITSDVEALQPLVLTNNGGFYPRVINDAFDKITIIAQQLIEQVGRSLKLPISSTASATLPDPVPNGIIAWNSAANGFVNVAPGDLATVAGYADARVETFNGNGSTTAFTIAFNPGVLANLDISISGVTQVAGVDFTWTGTTITFAAAPPSGAVVQVRYARPLSPLPNFDSILTSVGDAAASAAAAAASAAGVVTATGYLVSLDTPTGTANALVSSPNALTPIKDAAANQLLILPITANNTGAVTLTVPGVGGGVARPVRYGLGISLLANSLIAGQFALLKYIAASGVYLLVYPNNLSQDGRFALIFRTGASTTNALVTTTQYGNLGAYNVNDLFLCPMAVSNSSGTVTLNIDGIGAKPLTSATGDPLPVPAWADNGVVLIRYRADIDKFVLVMTNYTVSPSDALAPAKTPSYHVVGTSAIGDGLASRLVVTPLTPLPNNSFANTYLHVRFPADRPAEGGMVIKIVGFNDAEYLQIRDFNAVDQVATGRWLAGDVGVIARDPVSSLFYLVRVDRRTPVEEAVVSSQTDFYAMANSRIYALARFSK